MASQKCNEGIDTGSYSPTEDESGKRKERLKRYSCFHFLWDTLKYSFVCLFYTWYHARHDKSNYVSGRRRHYGCDVTLQNAHKIHYWSKAGQFWQRHRNFRRPTGFSENTKRPQEWQHRQPVTKSITLWHFIKRQRIYISRNSNDGNVPVYVRLGNLASCIVSVSSTLHYVYFFSATYIVTAVTAVTRNNGPAVTVAWKVISRQSRAGVTCQVITKHGTSHRLRLSSGSCRVVTARSVVMSDKLPYTCLLQG